MTTEQILLKRSDSKCELCQSTEGLSVYEVAPSDGTADQSVLICEHCRSQIERSETMQANHFRCLNDSMWSPVPAVQVLSYRLLHQLKGEGWPLQLLDMLYLDDTLKSWADKGVESDDDDSIITQDSNGTKLSEGDDVIVIKDLDVKGTNFVAKRGTQVKNIHLTDNPRHIEGKVNGIQVVLLSAYLKKT